MIMPEHMDCGSRNRRLYETLLGMGLFVEPIPDPNNPDRILKMVVSADLPFAQSVAEQSAEAGIGATVERPVVGDGAGAAKGIGDNVVLLPSVRR